MLTLRRPSHDEIAAFIGRQAAAALSYPEAGMTRATAPAGYQVGHHAVELGRGRATFVLARSALERWTNFDVGWVEVHPRNTPPLEGRDVAVAARIGLLWALNACRVVYVVSELGERERYGFAYGTLPDHMEQGEELFVVAWDVRSDRVTYEVTAYSSPRHWLTRVGGPAARSTQHRFRRDSARAMQRAVSR